MKSFSSFLVISIILFVITTNIGLAQIPTNGLVAYYPFDGNANDESGNNLNGVINGATLTEDRFGNLNCAFYFDGLDDFIEVAHSELLNLTEKWSYCVWVKIPENPKQANRIIMHGEDFNDRHQESISFFNTTQHPNKFYHAYEISNGDGVATYSNDSYPERNRWYFIVGTRDTLGNYRLFIDGVEDGYVFGSQPAASIQAPLFIGVAVNDGIAFNNYLKGAIDDIRIYNRSLSQQEITELYNEGVNLDSEYEYWVPYVDNTSGPSGYGSRIVINSSVNGTKLQVDFDKDGIIDSIYFMQNGEQRWINYPDAEGIHIFSTEPVDISYFYYFADYGAYEDGAFEYSIPEIEFIGTEYWLPSSVSKLAILSIVDNNSISVNSTNYNLNKGDVQLLSNPSSGTHIISSEKIMVVAINYDSDRYGNSYAYTLIPKNKFGNTYYSSVEHPHNYQNSEHYSRLEIVAVNDATVLTINSDNFSLEAGETLTYQTIDETVIESNKPIYVIYISDIEAIDPWKNEMRHYTYSYSLLPELLCGSEYLLTNGRNSSTHGWPFLVESITSLENGNEIQFDVDLNGIIDTTISLSKGERFYLSEGTIQSWTNNALLFVKSASKILILHSYRNWWSGITEGTAARTIFPTNIHQTTDVHEGKYYGHTPNYSVSQNYPNPFNPVTTIEYQIPKAAIVKLIIYDILGNEISRLVDQEQQSGYYQVKFDATELPSGVYVYKLQAGEFINTKKMILLK